MKDIDWKILYELHRTPNITKVADRLYMTQPTLTKRLQSIESELKVRVVKRSTKGVQFTPEGEYLARQAERYLQFRGSVDRRLQDFQQQGSGTIRVASSVSFANFELPGLIRAYRGDHPRVGFDIEYAKGDHVYRFLKEGVSDLAFVRGAYDSGLCQKRLFIEQACLYAAQPFTLEDLPRMTYVQHLWGEYVENLLSQWWNQQTFHPGFDTITVRLLETGHSMIKKGLGYGVGFFHPEQLPIEGLYTIPMFFADGSPVQRDTWLIYSESVSKSPYVEDFIQLVEETYGVQQS